MWRATLAILEGRFDEAAALIDRSPTSRYPTPASTPRSRLSWRGTAAISRVPTPPARSARPAARRSTRTAAGYSWVLAELGAARRGPRADRVGRGRRLRPPRRRHEPARGAAPSSRRRWRLNDPTHAAGRARPPRAVRRPQHPTAAAPPATARRPPRRRAGDAARRATPPAHYEQALADNLRSARARGHSAPRRAGSVVACARADLRRSADGRDRDRDLQELHRRRVRRAADGGTDAVLNPADRRDDRPGAGLDRPRTSIARSSAARGAFEGWSNTTPGERSLALLKLADAIEEHADEIAELEAAQRRQAARRPSSDDEIPVDGRQPALLRRRRAQPGGQGGGRVPRGLHVDRSAARRSASSARSRPWNYPLMMAIWKIGPALAAGNTIVLKPAPSDAADDAAAGRARGRVPAQGRAQRRRRRQRGRPGARHPPRRRHGLADRLGRDRQVDRRARPRTRSSACTSSSAARRRSSSSTTPTWRPRSRRSPAPATTTPARTAPRRRACSPAEGLRRRRQRPRRAGRSGYKIGDTLDPDTTLGPLNSARQRERVEGFLERRPDHAEVVTGGKRARPARLLPRADRRRRPAPGRRDDPARDLRPGHHRPAVHATRPRRSRGPTARPTAWPPRSGRATSAARCACRKALRFGCVWINDHIPLASRDAARRLQAVRLRQGPLDVLASRTTPCVKHVMASLELDRSARAGGARAWSRRAALLGLEPAPLDAGRRAGRGARPRHLERVGEPRGQALERELAVARLRARVLRGGGHPRAEPRAIRAPSAPR